MANGFLSFVAGASVTLFGVSMLADSPQDTKPLTVADFPNLQKGLMETPGCLGVQAFAVNGGRKQVIAAWFENRKAMEAWYHGPMHSTVMAKFFPGMGKRKPFPEFKDEKSPMLVIASVTPGNKEIGNGSKLLVDQIAIEGYLPVHGGVAYGGTFAPEKLTVPGLVRIPAGQ